MALDLRLVESFVTVAETLNFTVAAERANTVQSAISAHIKQLERETDRQLIERGRGKRVALTDEGAAFLVQARRLLALADEVTRSKDPSKNITPLRLGTSFTFAQSIVPPAIAAYAAEADSVPVTVQTARSHELMQLLNGQEIDVALVFDQGMPSTRRHTCEVSLSWVASEAFENMAGAPLPLAFLADARDLRRHAFTALDRDGRTSFSLTTHPDPVGLRAVVAAGQAICVLPEVALVPPLVNIGPLLGLPSLGALPVSIYIASDYIGTHAQTFSHFLKKQLAMH